jgi:hypothetical protein
MRHLLEGIILEQSLPAEDKKKGPQTRSFQLPYQPWFESDTYPNIRLLMDWYVLWLMDKEDEDQEEKASACPECHYLLGSLSLPMEGLNLCNENWVAKLIKQKGDLQHWSIQDQEEFVRALKYAQDLCADELTPVIRHSDVRSISEINAKFPEFKSCAAFQEIFGTPLCKEQYVTFRQGKVFVKEDSKQRKFYSKIQKPNL